MHLRPATDADAELLFRWRNDLLTREMSRNSNLINWGDHLRWLSTRLSRPEPHLFIAEVEGIAVGTARIDRDEVSYAVAPEHRGRGYATKMLKLLHEIYGPLKAEIKSGNIASITAAKTAGHIVIII